MTGTRLTTTVQLNLHKLEHLWQRHDLHSVVKKLIETIYRFGRTLQDNAITAVDHNELFSVLCKQADLDESDLSDVKVLILNLLVKNAGAKLTLRDSPRRAFERERLYTAIKKAFTYYALPDILFLRMVAAAMAPVCETSEFSCRTHDFCNYYYELYRQPVADEVMRAAFALGMGLLGFRVCNLNPLLNTYLSFGICLSIVTLMASARMMNWHIDNDIARRLRHPQNDAFQAVLREEYKSPQQAFLQTVNAIFLSSSAAITRSLPADTRGSPTPTTADLPANRCFDDDLTLNIFDRSPTPERATISEDEYDRDSPFILRG